MRCFHFLILPIWLGLEYVRDNVKHPSVASMSLGARASNSLDAAVKALYDAGVTVVVAAGNSDRDACHYSPARVPEVSPILAWRV